MSDGRMTRDSDPASSGQIKTHSPDMDGETIVDDGGGDGGGGGGGASTGSKTG